MTFIKRAETSGSRFVNPVATQVGGLGTMTQVLFEFLTNREERVPRTPPGPFRTHLQVYRQPPQSGLRVTWLGHTSILMEIDGVRILIDPMWDERASPLGWMGPKRFYASPLALEDLPRIDVVLISHDHYDHLGKRTVRALAKLPAVESARWVTSLGVGRLLQGFGVGDDRITELDWTDSVRLRSGRNGAEVRITALPARHFSGRTLWNRFETLWSSFVIEGAQHKVYFGADSGMWEGFAEIGQAFGPFDLTMLEIGAFNELWRDIHLGPDGAAKAFAAMGGSGLLMPIHWGLFDLALHGWRAPIARMTELADAIGIRLWSPQPGAPTEVVEGVECRSDWWREQPETASRPGAPTAAARGGRKPRKRLVR